MEINGAIVVWEIGGVCYEDPPELFDEDLAKAIKPSANTVLQK